MVRYWTGPARGNVLGDDNMATTIPSLAVGQEIYIIGKYSGRSIVGTVTRVTPSGKQVMVQHPQMNMPHKFIWQPTINRFFNDYCGYLGA